MWHASRCRCRWTREINGDRARTWPSGAPATSTRICWRAGAASCSGPGNAQLPLPPMLMFERISSITETGGAHGKGQIVRRDGGCRQSDVRLVFRLPFQGRSGDAGLPRPRCAVAADGLLPGLARRARARPGARASARSSSPAWCCRRSSALEYVVDMKRVILRKLKLGDRRRHAEGRRPGDLHGDRPAGRAVRAPTSSRPRPARESSRRRPRGRWRGCRHGHGCARTAAAGADGKGEGASDETRRRHRHGDRLQHRQQHPGGAGLAARGPLGHRRAPTSTSSSASAARCTASRKLDWEAHGAAQAQAVHEYRHGLELHRHGSGDPRFRPRGQGRLPTSAPASSWARAARRPSRSSRPPIPRATQAAPRRSARSRCPRRCARARPA